MILVHLYYIAALLWSLYCVKLYVEEMGKSWELKSVLTIFFVNMLTFPVSAFVLFIASRYI